MTLCYILPERRGWVNMITQTITHTYPHTLTHLQPHVNIPTKSQRFFDCIFSIFDSFHFLNCLMIVVLQKISMTQGSQSKFHGIEYIYNNDDNIYIYIYIYIPKTLKMVLDTQRYKVRIVGKVEQSRERSSALPYTSV